MSGLRAWWAGLALREQRALGLGGVALGLVLTWLFWLEPLAARVESASRELAAERATSAWLRALPVLAAPQVTDALPEGETALGMLNQDLRSAGLDATLKRLMPAGEGRFELAFEGTAWQALAGGLETLARQRGARITRAQVEKTGTSGLVNAQLTLVFPGAPNGTP